MSALDDNPPTSAVRPMAGSQSDADDTQAPVEGHGPEGASAAILDAEAVAHLAADAESDDAYAYASHVARLLADSHEAVAERDRLRDGLTALAEKWERYPDPPTAYTHGVATTMAEHAA